MILFTTSGVNIQPFEEFFDSLKDGYSIIFSIDIHSVLRSIDENSEIQKWQMSCKNRTLSIYQAILLRILDLLLSSHK